MRIMLAIPTNRGINPLTIESCLKLIAKSKYDFEVICPSEGYTIAENRNYTAVQAVNGGFDYLFFVDDDMIFDTDYVDRMVEHDKDIVGGVYASRMDNSPLLVYSVDNTVEKPLDLREDRVDHLTQVHAKGTALMLIKTEVFKKIPQPWFEFTYFINGKCKEGEDWGFCKKAIKYGFSVWADPTVKTGHIGEKNY